MEVELLAQAGGECVHGAGGVVVGAAEAPVDHVLHPRRCDPSAGSSTRGNRRTDASAAPQPGSAAAAGRQQ